MATSKPYGYLAIDLKPDTSNDKRLWPNVFEQTSKAPTAEQPYCSEQKTSLEEQTVEDPASDPNFRKLGHCQSYPLTDLKHIKEVHLHYHFNSVKNLKMWKTWHL